MKPNYAWKRAVAARKIDARLAANPNANLIVLGDFNDLHSSKPVKTNFFSLPLARVPRLTPASRWRKE